jgi:pimeloyl-ACP methyl ester carboxylesterase
MRRQPVQAPPLPPGRLVQLGNRGQTFVRDTGPGPAGSIPVVLLHGWSLTADVCFVDAYQPLSTAHRVIALDLRHHGRGIRAPYGYRLRDATDDVIALLDELRIETAILCGYSMGGVIAADAVSRYPHRVAGTAIVASAACYTTTARDRLIWRCFRSMRVLPRIGVNQNPGGLMSVPTRLRNRRFAARWDWARSELQATPLADVVSAAVEAARVDLRPQLEAATRRPSEMVLTTRDHLCRPAMQYALAARLGSHITEVDAGHDLPLSDPDRFTTVLLEVLGNLNTRITQQDSPA